MNNTPKGLYVKGENKSLTFKGAHNKEQIKFSQGPSVNTLNNDN